MKKKIWIVLLATLVVCALTLALVACEQEQHKCNDACPECGLCLTDCNDVACSDKCLGHDVESGDGNEKEDDNTEAVGFEVIFVCDEHVSVVVYETQDMSGDGVQTNTAYSRDGDSGALLNDGNGQVNFRLVFADGYKLDKINPTPTTGYNNLKGSADTEVEDGYRITKITANLTVTVTSQEEEAAEDLTQGYEITFVHDEHVKVVVYKTQDLTADGEETDKAYSRESGTGTLTKDSENAQINFVLVFDEGYELGSITATEGAYKNIKYPSEIGTDNAYRITKISGDLTVSITSQEEGAAEDLSQGYEIVFKGEHFKIIVYRTQTDAEGEETNTAYSRDGDNGTLLKDGKGQVNFKIVCDEGYEVDKIVINGEYNQIKDIGNGVYRITKIASDLTVNITVIASSKA